MAVLVITAGCQKQPAAGHHHAHHGPRGHAFPDPEKWAPRWNHPARDVWQKPEEVIRLMQIEPGMTVADVGAGTGYFEPFLSLAVGETGSVWALDAEAAMVEYLANSPRTRPLANLKARLVPYDDPKLPRGRVDRVLIVNTWHHVHDRVEYGRKLLRAFKDGGSVFIVDYTMESERGPPADIRLTPDQVMDELEAAGFEPTVLEESLPNQYVVRGATSPLAGDAAR